jgi:glycerol-3-phosphate acyltransferase PlsY
MWAAFFTVLACHAVGSLPTAYLAGRYIAGIDIREVGDKNVGTANAWRLLGQRVGSMVFALDVCKGVGAIGIARVLMPGETGVVVAGVAAVAGHNWPVFLSFHGGRGAATTIGVLCALLPFIYVPLVLAGGAVLQRTRSATLAIAAVFAPGPMIAWIVDTPPQILWFSIGLPVLVGLSHLLSERLWAQGPAPGTPLPGA